MRPSFLQRLALRIRPDLQEFTGVAYTGQLLNVYLTMLGLPLGGLGIIWVTLTTDYEILRQNIAILLFLAILGLLFSRFPFELHIQLRPGVIASSGGTLYFLVALSALFIFGTVAVWLVIIVPIVRTLFYLARETQAAGRWAQIATLAVNLASGAPALLVGYLVYKKLGGQIPLDTLDSALLWPASAFIVTYWLLPFVILFPALLYLTHLPDLVGDDAGSKSLHFFLLFNSSIPNLALPFVFLGAALYTLNGPGYYVFFLAGILLTSILANSLTNNANQRAQRARELGVIEALGRDILKAPPDGSTLAEILSTHIPAMFIHGRLMIWLTPSRELYRSPGTLPSLEQIIEVLPGRTEPYFLNRASSVEIDTLRDAVILPIQNDDGARLGGVYFDLRRDQARIQEYVPALQSLAAQISSALYRTEVHREALLKERMANELELAGRIQANFLPEHIPSLQGYDIAASLTPALQTSGDFYDFIPLPDGRLGILIADVADKGTGAALFMALTRTLLRTYALEHPDEPALVFQLTNDRVHEDTQAQLFITTFYGIIDTQQHTLTYVNGGHNPPYLFSPDKGLEPQALIRTGVPIGMLDDVTWQSNRVPFPVDGTLILYTDGVTEAQNVQEEFFEDSRLLEVGNSCLGLPAGDVHNAILVAIRKFVGDAPQFDDITLLAIRRIE